MSTRQAARTKVLQSRPVDSGRFGRGWGQRRDGEGVGQVSRISSWTHWYDGPVERRVQVVGAPCDT